MMNHLWSRVVNGPRWAIAVIPSVSMVMAVVVAVIVMLPVPAISVSFGRQDQAGKDGRGDDRSYAFHVRSPVRVIESAPVAHPVGALYRAAEIRLEGER
jgi:hypothetical protein